MAGSDSQKELITLIRSYATERSEGERRIVNQKKLIEELRSQLDASNMELEKAKREKETTEQELKGYEVELSINESSLQALEARIALANNEVSKVDSELEALKKDAEQARLAIENKLAQTILHADQEEQQYKAELEIHDQIQKELSNLERKLKLMESVMKEIMELQELSRQTSELEEKCAALGGELQKMFLCPLCNRDNSEELGELLQISDGS